MRILSIDTTSIAGSVALSENDKLIAQEQQGAGGTHSEKLFPTIDHLLQVAKWQQSDIQGIAVAIGPGSFTGLRIGLAAAKGFALALDCPVAGVSSLATLALNGLGFSGTVIPLIDARRSEIYAAAWQVDSEGNMKQKLEELVAPPDQIVKLLSEIKGDFLLVGDGALAYSDYLCKGLKHRAHIAEGAQVMPQAVNLALLSWKRLVKGRGDDVASLVPNYIRRSDAEIGFMGKRKIPPPL
ncbi:MAG: tRNA (adenosine(37)-N6)-threonylcarbamoyltransferase complex dimerization subunit type 1 TsaB [Pseudomonadota bacterium]